LNIPKVFDILHEQVKSIGTTLEKVSKLVVTHAHVDHFGLSCKLKALSGAKLYLHRMERHRALQAPQLVQRMGEWFLSNGMPEREMLKPRKLPTESVRYVSSAFPDVLFYTGEVGLPDIDLRGEETNKYRSL
jgi:glyoxylase-like metal-dependent hydrolase (beta-lactamase superfamily II)